MEMKSYLHAVLSKEEVDVCEKEVEKSGWKNF
jgi:hypothetical protein